MKTERINIYISETTKKKMTKYAEKHHVSMSTIAMYLAMCYMELQDILKKDYVITGCPKTSIKPKPTFEATQNEKSKIYTNIIEIYFNNRTKDYLDDQRDNVIRDKFNKFIQAETEVYWNYNQFLRNQVRSLRNKQVREYMKRKIEEQEK